MCLNKRTSNMQTTVLAFGRKMQNLEQIFLQMIEGGNVHANHT
jgi:hypothetical protein